MSTSWCWILSSSVVLKSATQVMLTCLSRILVFCWCNHLWQSGQFFFVHFLMSVSGFRWWDHKPLLHIPGLVVGSWGSWFLLLVSFWSTADCSLVRSKLFVYNKRSGSAGVRHSIFYAFSVGVMNWFVREKDDYMLLYENYYLFSYIIHISVDIEPHFYK